MSDIKKEREELIELFGMHFETLLNLPPLGSRILATLIIDTPTQGVTFEEVVENMGASKSSVSTNLNLLLKLGKINYYTLPGNRKKYFRPSPFSDRFDNYLKMVAFEKNIIDRIIAYRSKTNTSPTESFELEKALAYKEHMLEMEQLFIKTIERFKEIEKNSIQAQSIIK
jgi:DNA-binding transcriptional regulator GbsR (MarR family)